jgi:hypothetical protein
MEIRYLGTLSMDSYFDSRALAVNMCATVRVNKLSGAVAEQW